MESKAKIVLQVVTDAEEAKKQAKNVGKQVAENVEKGANKFSFGGKIKDELNKLKDGIQAVGISADKFGKIGKLFAGGGWIGAIAAGIGIIAQQAMQLWDHLTVTADELIKRGQSIKKTAQEGLNTAFKNEGNTQGYIQRLRELNAIENKSNLEKMEAIAIIQELTKVYGELGLSISASTGKVLGLDKALREIEKRNRQMKGREAEKVTQGARQTVEGHLQKIFGSQYGKKGLDEKGDRVFTPQGNIEYVQTTAEEREKRKKFNQSTQGKIDYLTERRNNATTEKDISALDAAISALKELKKAEEEQQNVKQYGFRTEKQYLDMLKEENAQIRKNREEAKKRAKQYSMERNAKQEREFYAGLSPASTKQAYQQVRLEQRQTQIQPLIANVKQLDYKRQSAQFELQQARSAGDVSVIKDAYNRLNTILNQLTKAEEEVRKKQTQIEDIQHQINRLKREQTENDLKQLKTDEQRIKKLKRMAELEKQKESTARDVNFDASASKSRNEMDVSRLEEQLNSKKGKRAQITFNYGISQFTDEVSLNNIITNLKKKMKQAMEKGDTVEYSQLNKQLEEAESKLESIKQKTKGGFRSMFANIDTSNYTEEELKKLREIYVLDDDISSIEQKIKQIKNNIAGADIVIAISEKEALQAKMKQMQIEAQIEELRKRAKDYYENTKRDLDAELNVQNLLLQGQFEQAEKAKLINELKKQGLIIDKSETEEILKRNRALKQLNVDKSIKQQGYGLLDRVGTKDKNYQYEKRIRELEEANGVSLTQTQKDKIKTLVNLQFKLEDLQKIKPDFSDLQIKTNELTARGGFAGGAVMPNIEAIDKQIMDYQARSTTLLNDIKNILRQGGVI